MTTTLTPTAWSEVGFEEFLRGRDEPDWITARRRDAFAHFVAASATELDPEEFKRVDLRAFRPQQFALTSSASGAESITTLMGSGAAFAGTVEHRQGQPVASQLDPALAAKGVLFGSLAELLPLHREQLEPYFCHAVPADADRFSAWHAAYWQGGAVLYVPRNVQIEQPLHSVLGLQGDGASDFSHTLIILEEGASATLLEETLSASPTAAGLHVGAVELYLAPRSHLGYVQLQNWNQRSWHFAHQSARIGADAALQWTVGGLGGRLAHIHQEVHLDGKGATAEVNGVTFATDRQVLSYYTQQTHHAPRTQSDLLYKDVVRDDARCIWRGMIKVDPEAQLTDGYQRNDSLLLSEQCRADAIPGLEIEADDVRCTHGATAGRVDEEQLFYCMCRGLSRREAMHLIVEGFFQRVFDRIPVEVVRSALGVAVKRKLGLLDAHDE